MRLGSATLGKIVCFEKSDYSLQKSTATYIKLQDAYVSESNKVGSWKLVGYVAPGATKSGTTGTTTNFEYTAGTAITADATSGKAISDLSTAAVTWSVKNIVALNDCAVNTAGAWTVSIQANSNGNSVEYTAKVANNDCLQLTPSFELIGASSK